MYKRPKSTNLCTSCNLNFQFVRNVCKTCYRRLVKTNKLQTKKRGISPKSLTKFQKEVLIGTLLGDAALKKSKTSTLRINRSLKDKDYLNWQFKIFEDFCDRKPWQTIKNDRGKIYEGVSFETRSSSIFAQFRSEWYQEQKIVPGKIKLTPVVVAIWLCDDGCIISQNNKLNCKFATNGFSYFDVLILCKKLNDFTKENFRVGKNGKGFVILGSHKSTCKLVNLVRNYIPKCMNRKLKHCNINA